MTAKPRYPSQAPKQPQRGCQTAKRPHSRRSTRRAVTETAYRRAEAAALIVRMARRWVRATGGITWRIGCSESLARLTNAVRQYEALLSSTEPTA